MDIEEAYEEIVSIEEKGARSPSGQCSFRDCERIAKIAEESGLDKIMGDGSFGIIGERK